MKRSCAGKDQQTLKFDFPIYALYLALRAARHRALGVRFDNERLRRYLLGHEPGKRLSKPKIDQFAKRFRPVFPHHEILHDQQGAPYLVLYLNEKDESVQKKRLTKALLPNDQDIVKATGLPDPNKQKTPDRSK